MKRYKLTQKEKEEVDENNFVLLEEKPSRFSFKITNKKGQANGCCELTDEEYKVFDAVLSRMEYYVMRY